MEYSQDEKERILEHYLAFYQVCYKAELLALFAQKVAPVPREIHNLVVKIRDFQVSKKIAILTQQDRENFLNHTQIDDGGMMPLHKKYLEIL